MITYEFPSRWIFYDLKPVLTQLAEAKASVMALRDMPCQKDWANELQIMQLKREVAGTSRIEGAEFTDRELDAALNESPEALLTRSQKQAAAALKAYKWIEKLPDDHPIDEKLILEIHRLMVSGADDDHCPPGRIRQRDQNVNFGAPKHRGATGGEECQSAFCGRKQL
jgi:Fic family protein